MIEWKEPTRHFGWQDHIPSQLQIYFHQGNYVKKIGEANLYYRKGFDWCLIDSLEHGFFKKNLNYILLKFFFIYIFFIVLIYYVKNNFKNTFSNEK